MLSSVSSLPLRKTETKHIILTVYECKLHAKSIFRTTMDSINIRQMVTYIAKVATPRLTQGQIDFHYQYCWGSIKTVNLEGIVSELKGIQLRIDEEGETDWASGQHGKRDPLRTGEIPLGNKQKMDWEF